MKTAPISFYERKQEEFSLAEWKEIRGKKQFSSLTSQSLLFSYLALNYVKQQTRVKFSDYEFRMTKAIHIATTVSLGVISSWQLLAAPPACPK